MQLEIKYKERTASEKSSVLITIFFGKKKLITTLAILISPKIANFKLKMLVKFLILKKNILFLKMH